MIAKLAEASTPAVAAEACHFGESLMRRRSSPGVFLVSQFAPIGEVIDELMLIWAASDAEEWKNRIVKVPQS
jgi:hypothetical protein